MERVQGAQLQGRELKEARQDTKDAYVEILERERQPVADYFPAMREDLDLEVPLSDEEDLDFHYDDWFEWTEEDYMWLLFKIQQYLSHRDVWNYIYDYMNRIRPDDGVKHKKSMYNLMSGWQETFLQSIEVQKKAEHWLDLPPWELNQGGMATEGLRLLQTY